MGNLGSSFPSQRAVVFFILFFSALSSPSLGLASEPSAPATTLEEKNAETQPSEKPSFWKEKFSYSGVLRQETAFRLGTPKNFSKIKQFAEIYLDFDFNETVKMKIGGRAWYDAVYDLTDQYPPDVDQQMRSEIALRDAYLDLFAGDVQIRLGHQRVIWGEALAQFFADVVNPLDLREFILPTFDYIRLPIWAIDLRWFFLPNATIELIATPDQTVDKLALPGADFSFFPPPGSTFEVTPFLPGIPFELLDDKAPSQFSTWNGGGRITFLTHGWDFSWLYYNTISHQPFLFKSLALDLNSGGLVVLLNPVHKRIQHFGFTFSKGVKSSIIRGEFVYTKDFYFNNEQVLTDQGLVKADYFRYVLGWDTTLGGKVDMIAEFQQQVILGDTENITDPAVDSFIALRFETGLLNETLIPELVFVVGLHNGQTLIRPKITYLVTDSVALSWGADIFTGPLDSLYGQFRDQTRIYMNTQWTF